MTTIGGHKSPEGVVLCVDVRYVLFAACLLAADHPAGAAALVARLSAVSG